MASNNAKVGYGIDIILKGGGVICAHTITLPAAAYKAACFRVVHAKFWTAIQMVAGEIKTHLNRQCLLLSNFSESMLIVASL